MAGSRAKIDSVSTHPTRFAAYMQRLHFPKMDMDKRRRTWTNDGYLCSRVASTPRLNTMSRGTVAAQVALGYNSPSQSSIMRRVDGNTAAHDQALLSTSARRHACPPAPKRAPGRRIAPWPQADADICAGRFWKNDCVGRM